MNRVRRFAKRIIETYIMGTKRNEHKWATMHLRNASDWRTNYQPKRGENAWVMEYWNSINHPHRAPLIERIARLSPSKILEIGANCGPNLYLLAKKLPNATLIGTDINPKAVYVGKKLFTKEGMTNVTLLTKKADDLNEYEDNSFDVVFTDAVLILVGPDKIKTIAREMLRISKKALILVEWQCAKGENDPRGRGIYYGGRWKRNYVNLFASLSPKSSVHLIKLSPDQWPDSNWHTFGHIIEIIK